MIGPADLQGHWRRAWIRAPGLEDGTTRVHWMQCGALYADLRIPATRPDPGGATCLAELDPPALAALMAAEGFAGTIDVREGICTWARHVNWHGAPEGIDAGRMSFDAAGDLIEDGVHAEYRELWRRMPDRPSQAQRVRWAGLEGVLVISDSRFLLGLGTPGAPSSAPLRAALQAGSLPDGIAEQFRGLYLLGRWYGGQGVALLCTNPFLEGMRVLTRRPGGYAFTGMDFHGRRDSAPLEPLDA